MNKIDLERLEWEMVFQIIATLLLWVGGAFLGYPWYYVTGVCGGLSIIVLRKKWKEYWKTLKGVKKNEV